MRADSTKLFSVIGSQNPNMNSTSFDDLPATILESFLPGFGFIRRLLISSCGFDVTFIVSGCLVLIGVFSGSKYLYRALSSFAQNYLMSSVHIEPNTVLYGQVMAWVSEHVVTARSRNLTARMGTTHTRNNTTIPPQLLQPQGSKPFDFSLLREQQPVMYTPHYGDHGFWYRGRYFMLHREKRDLTVIGSNNPQGMEAIETLAIKTFGFSPSPIQELINHCKREDAERSRTLTAVRRPHRRADMWQAVSERPSRPLDTVYLNPEDKALLLRDATEFLHPLSKRFYASRGIPYRRGYLIHGPPGTGKTTMSMTLAGYFGLDLCALSLVESSMTDERLGTLFAQLPSHCIVLLEDIDAAGLEARDVEKPALNAKPAFEASQDKQALQKQEAVQAPQRRPGMRRGRNPEGSTSDQPNVTLSGLLNALDGVASQEGRILIMTTNDPEALDKALIRPGRVDMQVYFGNLSKTNAKDMFIRMYQDDEAIAAKLRSREHLDADEKNMSEDTVDELKQREQLSDMAQQFADMLPDTTFTPAEVQGFLLSRRKSPEKALAEFEAWKDEMMKAKERGTNIIPTKAVEQAGG